MTPSFSLEDVLGVLPEATGELLARVVEAAARLGIAVQLVGGPVRDLVLGRGLVDVDLRVEGDARALAEGVSEGRAGAGLSIVGHDRFGTVRIESENASLDLAGLRHETYAQPGALPDVEPGTREQDVRRRDFSINALVCPLDGADPGRRFAIEDLEGGLADLAKKRLRVLHARSFHDDPTRAWRAARFAARLGFSLDRFSRNALRNALRDGAFAAVSGERFRRELQLVFEEAHHGVQVGRVLRLLSDWHVLATLEPGLTLGKDRAGPLRRLSKAIAEPEWAAPRWRPWAAGAAIWLAPLPAAQRRRVLERLAVRGEQAARIVGFGRDADRLLKTLARARGRGAVDAALGDLAEETIQALYSLADVPVRRRILRWGAEDRRRRAPVGGAELVALGLTGPDVGRALKRIRAGFLDGEVANREEALALAEEIARRAGRGKPARKAKARRRKVAAGSAIADTRPGGGRTGSGATADAEDSARTRSEAGEASSGPASGSAPSLPRRSRPARKKRKAKTGASARAENRRPRQEKDQPVKDRQE